MNVKLKLLRQLTLWPLSVLYTAALELYLRWRLPRRQRLSVPVVSIGNISCGGTGKTPAVISIARHLLEHGYKPVILSRGHGGHYDGDHVVVSDGNSLLVQASLCGDEPYLMAQSLPGVPLIVGRDRRITGQIAIDRFKPDLILLDDGFQFYQLERDLDIVLVKAADPIEGGILPAGNLREPISHLRRAHAMVMTGEGKYSIPRQPPVSLIPVFTAHRKPTSLVDIHGRHYSIYVLERMPVGCFCGLGNPEQFEQSLQSLGADIVCSWRLRDHQPVSISQLNEYMSVVSERGGKMLICTQKDFVKLPPSVNDDFVRSLEITMQFDDTFWPWFDVRIRGLVPRVANKSE